MRLIDADKLLRDIEHYNLSDGKFQHWVEIQPTVETERKKGKWIRYCKLGVWECDQCGTQFKFPFKQHYFCPNCGADMRGEQE